MAVKSQVPLVQVPNTLISLKYHFSFNFP